MNDRIGSLIESFSNDKLRAFFESKNRNFIPEQEYLSEFEDESFSAGLKLGKIDFDNFENLVVCSFRVNSELTERSGKRNQYQKARDLLKALNFDNGLMVFYDVQGNFRLSLVYSNYYGKKRDFSSFRRFTFFVSKNQTNKTFRQQMESADFSSMETIKYAFSVEKVTKAFYQEIFYWYLYACKICRFPMDAEAARNGRQMAVIRMITRLIFVWFMQVRGIIDNKLFDEKYIQNVLCTIEKDQSTYYRAILQNLFFATLNTPQDERRFRNQENKYKWVNKDFGNHSVYRYEDYFKEPNTIQSLFGEIPFLNGGLFECLDDKEKHMYVDGFTRQDHFQPVVPNQLFFADPFKTDLNEDLGTKDKNYETKGLFKIFSEYNFTIDENTADDQDIALDPELLGKVFENLLASYNPETENTARKETGSFYTPREIVEFMVDESLLGYFMNALVSRGVSNLPKSTSIVTVQPSMFDYHQLPLGERSSLEERLRKLIYGNDLNANFSDQEKNWLIGAIESLRVLDPACGSGAFPMSMLHKLVIILNKLDTGNIRWKELQLDKAVKRTEAAYHLEDPEERKRKIEQIENDFNNNTDDYGRKLYLIESCLYGVDIQPIAIQITKLRFFISLLVDQIIDSQKENWGIRPLPNLEMKFVAANSLLTLKQDTSPGKKQERQLAIETEEIKTKKIQLAETRHKLFSGCSPEQKKIIKKKDKKLREEIGDLLKVSGFDLGDAAAVAAWDPFDQNNTATYFDPEWMLGVKDGFNIVLGNPPYYQLSKFRSSNAELQREYQNAGYKVYAATGDLYCLFVERGYDLLKEKTGILCYITSNKWMRAGYGEKLRYFLSTRTNPVLLIDFPGQRIFEAATVDVVVLKFEKTGNKNETVACTVANKEAILNLHQYIEDNNIRNKFGSIGSWVITNTMEASIKEKIEAVGKPLKDWDDISINYGIKTGLNEAFIINGNKRKELIEADPKSAEIIRPILRGRDIKRYGYEFADSWLINTHNGVKQQGIQPINVDEYPAIKNYLGDFYEALAKRTDKGNTPYNLRDCAYMDDFYKQKIVWGNLNLHASFCIVEPGIFINAPSSMIVPGSNYLLSVLNSKLSDYYIRRLGVTRNGGYFEYKPMFIEQLPVPIIPTEEQESYNELISLICEENQLQLDALIYILYGLSPDEIAFINNRFS